MLSQAHRRSIHTSLTPLLGEEETDALMSEFPTSPHDMPVTTAHFDLALKDLRIEMHKGYTKIAMWTVSAVVGGMSLAAGIAAAVAQAIGNGGSP
jgi:hypothetical protein